MTSQMLRIKLKRPGAALLCQALESMSALMCCAVLASCIYSESTSDRESLSLLLLDA